MKQRRNIFVLSTVFVAMLVYLVFFTGLFSAKPIELQWRPLAVAEGVDGKKHVVVQFALSRSARLRSIQIIEADSQSAVWQLAGTPRSEWLDTFVAGTVITGLSPTNPEAGRPRFRIGQSYRLLLDDGRVQSTLDFTP